MHLIEVTTNQLSKEFIYLPEKLHSDYPNFVPPLYADEPAFYDPKKNLSMRGTDTIRFLASHNGEIVGRVMGIIPHGYNKRQGERNARFYQLDLIDNQEVMALLLNGISTWAKQFGMVRLVGPYGFSDKDPQGFQVDGFEHLPVISTATNPPYLPKHLESLGYQKEFDCVAYKIKVRENLSPAHESIYKRVLENKLIRLIEFKSKKEIKPYIVPVFRLVNETYAPLYGFAPMEEQEMKEFADKYLPILDPEFIKVVVDTNNEVIAFAVSVPDMSKGIQKAKGRLFPFGFLHILSSQKNATQLDLLLGAIKPTYRKRGIIALLAYSLMQSARKRKISTIDSHLILESNTAMRAECERAGGEIYKRYRIFGKRTNDV